MQNKTRVVKALPSLLTSLFAAVILFGGTAFAGTTPAISSATFKATTSDEVVVYFNMPVWGNSVHTTGLTAADFSYIDGNSGGAQTISSVSHAAGQDYAVLVMNQAAVAGDTGDTIKAVANSIFTVGGALPEAAAINLTQDTTAPEITHIRTLADGSSLSFSILFSEPVFTNAARGTIVIGDVAYSDENTDGADTVSSVAVSSDNRRLFLTMNEAIIAGDSGDTVAFADIYDAHGNTVAIDPTVIGSTGEVVTLDSVESVVGSDKVLVTFTGPVFNTASCSGAIQVSDFDYTDASGDNANDVSSVEAVFSGTPYFFVYLNSSVGVSDLSEPDTLDVVADEVYSCNGSAVVAGSAVDLDDTTDPVILNLTKGRSDINNTLTVLYSEPVQITGFTSGSTTSNSNSTVGDMTSGCTIAGLGSFASGNVTYNGGGNIVANNSAQTQFTITLGGSGVFVGGTVDCSGVFTPVATVSDLNDAPNVIETSSLQATLTTSTAWILSGNASSGGGSSSLLTAPTGLSATVDSDNHVKLTWSSSSSSNVKIYRGISPLPIDAGNVYAAVEAGVQTYTDTNVTAGQTVSYIIKSVSGANSSNASETLTITVSAGNTAETPSATTEEDNTTDSTTDDTTDTTTTTTSPQNYDEEKAKVVELKIVTIDIDRAANKCEAIVMLARAAKWEVDVNSLDDGFTDTPVWCKPYAREAKAKGVVKGRTATELGVAGEVSRYEVAVMLARVLGATDEALSEAAGKSLYSDEIVDWAKGAVNWLKGEGVMTGYPDGTFQGAKSILKVELAVSFARAFELY